MENRGMNVVAVCVSASGYATSLSFAITSLYHRQLFHPSAGWPRLPQVRPAFQRLIADNNGPAAYEWARRQN